MAGTTVPAAIGRVSAVHPSRLACSQVAACSRLRLTVSVPRRRFLRLAAGAAILPVLSRNGAAENYPSRPVRILVATSAGGSTDMGSGGNGSSGHMAGELFMMMTAVRMVHLPYRGKSLAVTDLLGGQAQVRHLGLLDRVRQGRHRAPARADHAGAAGSLMFRRWRNSCRVSRQAAGAVSACRETHLRISSPCSISRCGACQSQDQVSRGRHGRHGVRRIAGRLRQVHCRTDRERGEGGEVLRREAELRPSRGSPWRPAVHRQGPRSGLDYFASA